MAKGGRRKCSGHDGGATPAMPAWHRRPTSAPPAPPAHSCRQYHTPGGRANRKRQPAAAQRKPSLECPSANMAQFDQFSAAGTTTSNNSSNSARGGLRDKLCVVAGKQGGGGGRGGLPAAAPPAAATFAAPPSFACMQNPQARYPQVISHGSGQQSLIWHMRPDPTHPHPVHPSRPSCADASTTVGSGIVAEVLKEGATVAAALRSESHIEKLMEDCAGGWGQGLRFHKTCRRVCRRVGRRARAAALATLTAAPPLCGVSAIPRCPAPCPTPTDQASPLSACSLRWWTWVMTWRSPRFWRSLR